MRSSSSLERILIAFLLATWAGVLLAQPAADLNFGSQLLESQTVVLDYALAIHGGAGGDPDSWPEEFRNVRLAGLEHALTTGRTLLASGKPALEVVEAVVRELEDNEVFNAGRGCVLNSLGEHELDACIMDGSNLACGAVAGAKVAKNPITLARHVMTDTRHVLLMSAGADEFARSCGVELAPASYFLTPRQRQAWEKWKNQQTDVTLLRAPERKGGPADQELYFGTVGCVAKDKSGNLAAATSTGGLMGKSWGRAGDSPIAGAGNYAENSSCAVSGTGIGEEFIRHTVASSISARMRFGSQDLDAAVTASIHELPAIAGGVIAVDYAGKVSIQCNTPGMSHAYADSQGRFQIGLKRPTE